MITNDAFDDLVAGFYRAAGGALGWVDALRPFQRAVAALAVHLHAVDRVNGCVAFSHAASDMPAEAEFDYVRTYHRIDPRTRLVMDLVPGAWMNCWEHFDDAYVAGDPFYQQFLIPYGGRYVSGVKLLQDGSLDVILGVHRGRDSSPLDGAELAVCGRLARHLSIALTLHREHVRRWQHGRLGLELLERLRAPVALVDAERRLLAANRAAQTLMARHGGVVLRDGRLHGRRAQDESALLVGLTQLLRGDPDDPARVAVDKLFLNVGGRCGESALGLYLYVLRPHRTLRAFGDETLAMVLFHEPGAHLELDPFVVATAYDLTPAEARVAVASARGLSPEEIARKHSVSVNTIRSHLSTIFQKTGTARQSELVSVLAALPTASLGVASV